MAAWNPAANDIFLKAVDIHSPNGRQAYLDKACGSDAELRGLVEALLVAGEQAGSFLESPAPGLTAAVNSSELSEEPGSVIGLYKLLEQIGEGGMGVVFMAEQLEPVRRRVALKVIKPGMDTRQVIARFEAERQALAVMDHPSIARVLDAGATDSGRPYFVMELVRGVPITTFCDENNLPVRERLELFASLCQAIQHAHTKGIIHRDIKPTNVLVTRQDGRPVVKVIDFGVAKAMGQQLTEKTLFTNFTQMIGTPLYMSPEQTEQSGVDIDTRSDIYSLGVLLYELLTGSTPVDKEQIKKAAFDEVRRIIREDEPQTPSARISGSHTLPAIAAHRHIEPSRLSRLVRGELDWIVMKALEKDRSRRYETANAFVADLLHYLNDQPVLACPPSATYRFGKFARRNKSLLATATVMALAGLVAVGSLVVSNVRISGEVKKKEAALAAAQASLSEAMAAVDQMLTRVAQERLLSVPQMEPVRRQLLQDALKFYQRFLDRKLDNPLLRRETALAYARLAQLHTYLGQYAEAEKHYGHAFAMLADLAVQSPLEPRIRKLVAFAHIECGNTLQELGKRDGFEKHLRQAVQMSESLVKDFPSEAAYRDLLATANLHLISVISQASPEEYEKLLHRNLTLTTDANIHGQIYNQLANIAERRGRNPDAEQIYRQAVGCWEKAASENPSDHSLQIELGSTFLALARVIAAQDRLQDAEKLTKRAITALDKTVSEHTGIPNYRRVQAEAHAQHVDILKKLSRPAETEEACRRTVDLCEKIAADFPGIRLFQRQAFDQRFGLAKLLASSGRAEEAQQIYGRAVAVQEKREQQLGTTIEERRELAMSHAKAAGLLTSAGRTQDAVKLCRLAFAHSRKLAAELPGAVDQRQLANLFHEVGKGFPATQEAETAFRLALEIREKVLATASTDAHARWMHAHDHRHLAFIAQPDPARFLDVEKHFRAALDLFDALHAEFPSNVEYRNYLVDTVHVLVSHLATSPDSRTGNPQGALELAEKAVALDANSWTTWTFRGSIFADLGQWTKAAADFEKAAELKADQPRAWYYVALLRLQSGDRDGYRKMCREMLEHSSKSTDLDAIYRTAWTCVLGPDAVTDWGPVVQSAEKIVAASPKDYDRLNALGAVLYRAGRFEESAKRLIETEAAFNESKPSQSTLIYNWLFQAMTQHRLDHTDQANKCLEKALKALDQPLTPKDQNPVANAWNEQLTFQFLRHEAETLFKNESHVRDVVRDKNSTQKKLSPAP